ncbi:hypothetical protein C6497_13600 [Candidatus Poribacteria bacterium]|nr:MAG: hypothetical protein C6497_13600 [Candidatus Poribacteria bacterium]
MKNWKVEVSYKPDVPDAVGMGILQDIVDLGINGVESVRTAAIYWIEGMLDEIAIHRIGNELLADPITQQYLIDQIQTTEKEWTIEVQYKPGVTDAVGDSTVKGINDLGISEVSRVRTGKKYCLTGKLNTDNIENISKRLLMNDVIQSYSYLPPS